MAMVRVSVNVAVLEWTAGEQVTVERTRMVDGLISGGYLTVLAENVPDLPAEDTMVFPDVLDVPDTYTPGPIGTAVKAQLSAEVTVVPPRSGKGSEVAVWREFLAKQGIEAPADATKAVLIGLWDSRMAIPHPAPE